MGARLIWANSVHAFLTFRPFTLCQQFEIVDATSIIASIKQHVSILTSHWRYRTHALRQRAPLSSQFPFVPAACACFLNCVVL